MSSKSGWKWALIGPFQPLPGKEVGSLGVVPRLALLGPRSERVILSRISLEVYRAIVALPGVAKTSPGNCGYSSTHESTVAWPCSRRRSVLWQAVAIVACVALYVAWLDQVTQPVDGA